MLKTKSIHAPIEPGDGFRILTSRSCGRGIRKARRDAWMPNLGPSEPLLKQWKAGQLQWPEYVRRYQEEILHSPDIDAGNRRIKNYGQKFTLRLIGELAQRQNVTLMCLCPEEEQHCHRHILFDLVNAVVAGKSPSIRKRAATT